MAKHARTKPGEEWKPINWIEGAEDYYVSSEGRVKKNNKLLTQSYNRDGYKICYINLKPKTVHRLVAIAFHPNPDNLEVVDHINEKKDDNRADNLRWVTPQQNTEYANENRKKNNKKKNYPNFDILAIDADNNATLYSTQKDAEKGTGVKSRAISKVVNGYTRYIKDWRFVGIKSFTDERKR